MKTIAIAFLFLIPLAALAQEGSVVYEETIKHEVELPPEMAHMKDQFPSSLSTSKLLLFNESASLMKDVPGAESGDTEVESDGGAIRFRMVAKRADEETYTHFDEASVIEKREFMGRTFLISGAPAPLQWRLTDERSEFLGYMSQKAVAMRDTVAVEAWFTPEVPVPAGPALYGGLPGLILVLTEDDGRRSYVAKELSLEPLADDAIVPPTKGKEVTREEFDAIVEEKLKEMGAERRGNATIMIRRND